MKLKFAATALKDLHRLKQFIAQKNPIAATKYSDRLLKIIRQPYNREPRRPKSRRF